MLRVTCEDAKFESEEESQEWKMCMALKKYDMVWPWLRTQLHPINCWNSLHTKNGPRPFNR